MTVAARIALDGVGPIDVDVHGDQAWVALAESGGLAEIDLTAQLVMRTIAIGDGGGQVVATEEAVYAGGVGPRVAIIDAASGEVSNLSIGPIAGLAADGGDLWVLRETGEVVLVDRADHQTAGSVSVHIDADAHRDLVAGAGSA